VFFLVHCLNYYVDFYLVINFVTHTGRKLCVFGWVLPLRCILLFGMATTCNYKKSYIYIASFYICWKFLNVCEIFWPKGPRSRRFVDHKLITSSTDFYFQIHTVAKLETKLSMKTYLMICSWLHVFSFSFFLVV